MRIRIGASWFVVLQGTAARVFAAIIFAVLCRAESPTDSDTSKSTKPFLAFPDTESPDGHYAVAWGLPNHPDVWVNVSRFEEEHPWGTECTGECDKRADGVFESIQAFEKEAENYIVDVRTGRIVHKLQCPRLPGWTHGREAEPEFWMAGRKPNSHFLEVIWSPESDLVLINHTWKWDSVTFCAVQLRDGDASIQLDLNRPLGDAVRNFIAKSFPRGFQYGKKDLNVCFSEVKQLRSNKFSAHAEAVVERYWSSDGATVDFELQSNAAQKTFKVFNVRVH